MKETQLQNGYVYENNTMWFLINVLLVQMKLALIQTWQESYFFYK